jgi:REP element-mobilizing transposase RayT
MARPLRINIAGGWYHITSRGQRRQPIFHDDKDRAEFLYRLEEATKRYGVQVHAYVLMSNHYHLLIRTPKANTSEAMQWWKNGYGMWWNRSTIRWGTCSWVGSRVSYYSAVSEAIRRFERKKLNRAEVKKALRRVLEMLNMET